MDENNTSEEVKQKTANGAKKIANGAKNAVKNAIKFLWKFLKPVILKFAIILGGIVVIGILVWAVQEALFSVASDTNAGSSISGVTQTATSESAYIDPETGEEIPLIGMNEEGTMWVIPSKTVDYIRKQIEKTSDITKLNLTEYISPYEDTDTEEYREKVNKYIREFLKAEMVIYYPNLEY